jgi:predicted GTPase
MRIEREIGKTVFWIEMKDVFTPRERRAWEKAGNLSEEELLQVINAGGSDDEKADTLVMRINEARLALLRQWSSGCYLVDAKGQEYHSINDITAETLWDMDAPLVAMIQNAGTEAYIQRSTLGNRRGGRS